MALTAISLLPSLNNIQRVLEGIALKYGPVVYINPQNDMRFKDKPSIHKNAAAMSSIAENLMSYKRARDRLDGIRKQNRGEALLYAILLTLVALTILIALGFVWWYIIFKPFLNDNIINEHICFVAGSVTGFLIIPLVVTIFVIQLTWMLYAKNVRVYNTILDSGKLEYGEDEITKVINMFRVERLPSRKKKSVTFKSTNPALVWFFSKNVDMKFKWKGDTKDAVLPCTNSNMIPERDSVFFSGCDEPYKSMMYPFNNTITMAPDINPFILRKRVQSYDLYGQIRRIGRSIRFLSGFMMKQYDDVYAKVASVISEEDSNKLRDSISDIIVKRFAIITGLEVKTEYARVMKASDEFSCFTGCLQSDVCGSASFNPVKSECYTVFNTLESNVTYDYKPSSTMRTIIKDGADILVSGDGIDYTKFEAKVCTFSNYGCLYNSNIPDKTFVVTSRDQTYADVFSKPAKNPASDMTIRLSMDDIITSNASSSNFQTSLTTMRTWIIATICSTILESDPTRTFRMVQADIDYVTTKIKLATGANYNLVSGALHDMMIEVPNELTKQINLIEKTSGGGGKNSKNAKYVPFDRFYDKVMELNSQDFITGLVFHSEEIRACSKGIKHINSKFDFVTQQTEDGAKIRKTGIVGFGLTVALCLVTYALMDVESVIVAKDKIVQDFKEEFADQDYYDRQQVKRIEKDKKLRNAQMAREQSVADQMTASSKHAVMEMKAVEKLEKEKDQSDKDEEVAEEVAEDGSVSVEKYKNVKYAPLFSTLKMALKTSDGFLLALIEPFFNKLGMIIAQWKKKMKEENDGTCKLDGNDLMETAIEVLMDKIKALEGLDTFTVESLLSMFEEQITTTWDKDGELLLDGNEKVYYPNICTILSNPNEFETHVKEFINAFVIDAHIVMATFAEWKSHFEQYDIPGDFSLKDCVELLEKVLEDCVEKNKWSELKSRTCTSLIEDFDKVITKSSLMNKITDSVPGITSANTKTKKTITKQFNNLFMTIIKVAIADERLHPVFDKILTKIPSGASLAGMAGMAPPNTTPSDGKGDNGMMSKLYYGPGSPAYGMGRDGGGSSSTTKQQGGSLLYNPKDTVEIKASKHKSAMLTFNANTTLKYGLIISGAIILIVMLASMNRKRTDIDGFNLEMLESNGQTLVNKSAEVIELMYDDTKGNNYNIRVMDMTKPSTFSTPEITIDPFDTSSDDPVEDGMFERIVKLTNISSEVKVRPAMSNSLEEIYSCYIEMIDSYNRCNSIFLLKNSSMPFPIIEVILYSLVLMVCLFVLALLLNRLKPVYHVKELKLLKKLQWRMEHGRKVAEDDIPEELKKIEVKKQIADEMYNSAFKIVGTVFIVTLAVLLCVTIMNNSKGFINNLYANIYENKECYGSGYR
jgi:hypothetical protein